MTESYEWYEKNVLDEIPAELHIGDNDFEMPPFYKDSPEMRKQFARVYNSISLTDIKIGRLLDRLENDNLMDSTIIFFFADHGEGMPRGKTNGINYGYRVPFIVWFPPVYEHLSPWGSGGEDTDELVDFTDLAPTLISLAGGEIPQHFEGRPILGRKRMSPPSHLILSSDRSDNGIDMVRTVTDGRYVYSRNFMPFIDEVRYIRYMEIGEIKQQMRKDLAGGRLDSLQGSLFDERPAEFLYDIENDVWETKNLVNDGPHQPILEKMRDLLKKEVLKSRDIMFLPEYEICRMTSEMTPYQFRKDQRTYPLEKIYEVASLAGHRDRRIAKEQIYFLDDEDNIIRYWAIMGLCSQPDEYLQPYKDILTAAMHDSYPPVAVTASAIVYGLFDDPSAEEKLRYFCGSDNLQVSLMAINYLLYTERKEPFTDKIREVHQMRDRDYNVKAACLDFLGIVGLVPNSPAFRE